MRCSAFGLERTDCTAVPCRVGAAPLCLSSWRRAEATAGVGETMAQEQTTSDVDARSGDPIVAVAAVIFDCDGVVTRTASVHAAAWKEIFDAFFRIRAAAPGESLPR